MYGLYSRTASNQEWPMMARVRYYELSGEMHVPDTFTSLCSLTTGEFVVLKSQTKQIVIHCF